MTDDWSAEETDDPLYADARNSQRAECCSIVEVCPVQLLLHRHRHHSDITTTWMIEWRLL
jgi:hypothetical protein